jgi:hypothetical protein
LPRYSDALLACEVFRAFKAATAGEEQESPTTTWAFVVTGDKTCEECQKYKDDTYELENPDDLLGMFDYGEWIDEDTFAPNIHVNCECTIIRVD